MKERETGKSGAVLIVVILVVIALVGLGIASIAISTGNMLSRVTVGDAARAYYFAESGVEYAKAMRLSDVTLLPSGTFTDPSGDQFELTTTDVTNGIEVVSVGVVHGIVETRRRITAIVYNPWLGDEVPVGFDFDGDGDFDEDNWDLVGLKKATIVDTGPSGGEPALDLMGTEGRIDLNWQDNPELDLSKAWANNGNLIDYEIQMKVSPFETGNEQAYSHHFMLGLSFRLYPDPDTSYGVSFFRSRIEEDKKTPSWVLDRPALDDLRGTNVHLLLWYEDSSVFELINSQTLDDSSNLTFVDDGRYELMDYSTMLIKLVESVNTNGVRENNIVVYTQNVDVYPNWTSRDDVRWAADTNTFPEPVWWDDPAVTNHINTNITSEAFGTVEPSEVAVHVYYDLLGANKKFFDDFGMRMEGYESPSSGGSGQIQY